jgi:hypothetical protein
MLTNYFRKIFRTKLFFFLDMKKHFLLKVKKYKIELFYSLSKLQIYRIEYLINILLDITP